MSHSAWPVTLLSPCPRVSKESVDHPSDGVDQHVAKAHLC